MVIYGTHKWRQVKEGRQIHYTQKNNVVYAIVTKLTTEELIRAAIPNLRPAWIVSCQGSVGFAVAACHCQTYSIQDGLSRRSGTLANLPFFLRNRI